MSRRLFKQFSLLSAGLWVGLALVLGTTATYLVEQRMLEQATLASLDYFKNLARFLTTREDFVRLRTGADYEAFDRLIREHFFTSHAVTIKIYDRSGTTIYHSRSPGVVGRAFPENASLRTALQGQTVVGLSDLQGAEHLTERRAGYTRLLEVYIPIVLEGTSTVVGAYEIYSPIDAFYQKIWSLRLPVWGAVLSGLVLLYGALTLTFRGASRTIVQQNLALERTARELREAYEGLKQAQSQLIQSEKLASTGRLAAAIVHEVGNPLGSILGLVDLQLLCRGGPRDREECRDRSERVADEIVRLRRILQGLLDYARPGPPELAPIDVNRVVDKAVRLVAAQEGVGRIAWATDLAPSLPLAIADEPVLEQVLLNLLLNAAYATAAGGPIRVATGAGPAGSWQSDGCRVGRLLAPDEPAVAIMVTDRGPGIPPGHLERIFEPFFSTKPRGEGSGLGLAICHSLIDALHGTLAVSSPVGSGTTVRVLLRAASPAELSEALPHGERRRG